MRFNDAIHDWNRVFLEWHQEQGALTIIATAEVNEATDSVHKALGKIEELLTPYAGDPARHVPDYEVEKWGKLPSSIDFSRCGLHPCRASGPWCCRAAAASSTWPLATAPTSLLV